MVKAKDFWKFLCKELNYRFFAGVACKGLAPLYKTMKPDFMHYIPTANERLALGLVSGAYVGGVKGGVLMDMRFAYDLTSLFNFNIDHRIPFLVIGYGDEDSKLAYDFPEAYIMDDNYKEPLAKAAIASESKSVPGLVVIGEGVLG